MPRTYKPDPRGKPYRKYTEDEIKAAVNAYKTGNESLKVIAQMYNINKSVLYRHSTRTLKKQGGQTVLSEDVELYMIEYINICANWGYPFDTLDLRYVVKNYLDKLGRTVLKFDNNLPGPEFAASFLKRHKDKISQRISQNIKKNRAKVTPDLTKDYFVELEKSLDGVDPKNIINYDETNLTDDPGRKKILVKRGTKYPERVMNHSKASISLMMSASADGKLLPPYVVYKAQNMYDTWSANGPKGAQYNRTKSGWFDLQMFDDWIKTIVLPYFEGKDGKKCLIGDNLSSHISFEVIELCQKHNIHFVFLPSNSTHITQPLDVAFFRPMKIAWRNIMLRWKKTDGKQHSCIPKGCFPKLLKTLMEELHSNSESNIKAGFRKTGICPIDANQVLSRLPTEHNIEVHKRALDQSVLDLLKEMRYGTMDITEPKRKKKVDVIAGRSVNTDTGNDEKTEEDVRLPIAKKRKTCQIHENEQMNNSEINKKTNSKEKGKGNGKKTKRQDENIVTNETVNVPEENVVENVLGINNAEGKENNETVNVPEENVLENVLAINDLFFFEEDVFKMPIILEDVMLCENEVVIDNGIDKEPGIYELKTEHNIANKHSNICEEKKIKEEERKKKVKIIANESIQDVPRLLKQVKITKCKKVSPKTYINVSDNTSDQPSTSGVYAVPARRPSYYKNDEEILKDLMDDHII